ncbi:uncharacterized protein [Globicephala melas]|uniref:uncharacterized protein n=1 Tax=Globicephala melas TaxID=9731 RepID=UPI00293D2236|nr:collagen alpha-1(I) chain-like [Globicephala melas]XP_060166335.1 collagen alpha-1(I) chain-like [Globicephala melas]
MPSEAAPGKDPKASAQSRDPGPGGHLGGPAGLSPHRAKTLPGPRSRSHRGRVPAPARIAPCGLYLWHRAAGRPRVSELPCSPQGSCKSQLCGAERKRHRRPPPALPEREAGRPGRGREAWRGRGRPASATLPGPLRPPPLSMRGTTAPARNWDACAVASSKPLLRGPPRGSWEPSVGALSCGAECCVGVRQGRGRFREVKRLLEFERKLRESGNA